jgi:proteasome accessory factor A
MFFEAADRNYRGRDEETDWVLSEWAELLSDLGKKDPSKIADRVDWAAKFILLNQFREEEGLEWGDPWLESLDLEYHNIHPEKGLFRILEQEGRHRRLISDRQIADGVSRPPDFTRACGRSMAVNHILEENDLSYIIQWFGIQVNEGEVLYMLDPLKTYHCEVDQYFSDPPDAEGSSFEA